MVWSYFWPYNLGVIVTRFCNSSCPFCSEDSILVGDSELEYMDPNIAKVCIDEAVEQKNVPPTLIITGGEPFIDDRVFEIIGHAQQKGMRVNIETNGSYGSSAERTEEIMQRLASGGDGFPALQFSLDPDHNDPKTNSNHIDRVGVEYAIKKALEFGSWVRVLVHYREGTKQKAEKIFTQFNGQTSEHDRHLNVQLVQAKWDGRRNQYFPGSEPLTDAELEQMECVWLKTIRSGYLFRSMDNVVVDYRGNIFGPCYEAEASHPIHLGVVDIARNDNLTRAHDLWFGNPLVKLLIHDYLGAIYSRLRDKAPGLLRGKYYSHCDFCNHVKQSPDILDTLQKNVTS